MKIIEAIKKIYPTIQGGFVYWETQNDLTPWENPIDGLVWENTEFSKPTWEQIEAQLGIVELEEAKTSKLALLLTGRKDFQYKNVVVGGVTYTATQTACTNLDGAISVLTDNGLTQCNWLDANGNASVLTLVGAKQLRTAMFMQQSSAYVQEAASKAEIAACESVEEVNALDITFN